MDELTLFRGPIRLIVQQEPELLRRAGVVFAGGQSLFEAKRDKHPNVHAFPSSIDRDALCTGPGLGELSRPIRPPSRDRVLGFFGVIDERMDLDAGGWGSRMPVPSGMSCSSGP
jgi:hypothetical protein